MSLDDFLKTILILSVSGSLIVLTYFTASLLNEVRNVIKDARYVTKSVKAFYSKVEGKINAISNLSFPTDKVSSILSAVIVNTGIFTFLRKFIRKKRKNSEKEEK
ncbi:MAG: hypothetical protein Kow0081_0520 [Candidatus Dojkabacteria bacterium]